MKRFFYLFLFSLLCAAPTLRAQDAAAIAARQEAEENYKILRAKIDDLTESRTALQSRIQSLEKQIVELRAQVAKPTGNYATTDDLKRLADAIKEVDKKRETDNKRIIEQIGNLGKTLSHSGGGRVKEPPVTDEPTSTPTAPANPNQPTVTYTIKDGDYLSTIAKAYREKGFNVTVDSILKLNPGLKANALIPRTKILIPDTRTTDNKSDNK